MAKRTKAKTNPYTIPLDQAEVLISRYEREYLSKDYTLYSQLEEVVGDKEYMEDLTKKEWKQIATLIVDFDNKPIDKSVIDRKFASRIRVEMELALATIAKKYNLKIDIGGISFTEKNLTTSISMTTSNAVDALNQRCEKEYGIKIGSRLKIRSRFFTVTGFEEKRRGGNVSVKLKSELDGKVFGCPIDLALASKILQQKGL